MIIMHIQSKHCTLGNEFEEEENSDKIEFVRRCWKNADTPNK